MKIEMSNILAMISITLAFIFAMSSLVSSTVMQEKRLTALKDLREIEAKNVTMKGKHVRD